MLKSPENTKKYKPIIYLKRTLTIKMTHFFLHESDKEFWMKQDPTDWEKVIVDSIEVLRDVGSTTYYFSGKEYDELYIPSSMQGIVTAFFLKNTVVKRNFEWDRYN
jgi:hypothetical protein